MSSYCNINQLLTSKDICQMFKCSQSSLKTNFSRTAAAIKKKYNVDVVKCITAGNATLYQVFENTRALTIYEEKGNIAISKESLSFEAYEFFVFLVLSASPQGVFRGRRTELLEYVGIKPTKKNLETLDEVLKSLEKKDCISFHEDMDFIIIYLKARLENECSISVNMLKECQKIADENHKNINKLAQLEQVWSAILYCEKNQPFTYADLASLTGLSYKQIRDVKQLLEQNDAFITKRAGSYFRCLGMTIEENGIFS